MISSLLKKTRKTVFLGFSKLKLLKVIPYFQITYSHPFLRMKTTDKREYKVALYDLINSLYS